MEKILITPKDLASIEFLKRLLNELESVRNIEIVEYEEKEMKDEEFIAILENNRTSGFATQEKVLKTLNKIALANK